MSPLSPHDEPAQSRCVLCVTDRHSPLPSAALQQHSRVLNIQFHIFRSWAKDSTRNNRSNSARNNLRRSSHCQRPATREMALLPSVSQFFTSIPPATRLFTVTTIAASLFYLWIRWPWSDNQTIIMPYLLLVPGSSLFYPWTFVTAAF